MMNRLNKRPGTSLLGLAFDGGRLEGFAVRRTNGSVEIRRSFTASLSLDPLTNDPELVGREIRKHLEDAGIRERQCAVCLPLNWIMTLQVKLPDLGEADLESFLQIEAERGFPYGPETLIVSKSRFRAPGGEQCATLVAVSSDHVARLESVLKAAQLKPVTLALGISALQPPAREPSDAILALAPGEASLGLQISCGGGVAMLRSVDGAFEQAGAEHELQPDHIARELRITLGQLPADIRDALRTVRVFGSGEVATELTEELAARQELLGVRVEQVRSHAPGAFDVKLPADASVSPALSLAIRHLSREGTGLEFLPPKVSRWKQLSAQYSSGKLAWAGIGAGAVAAMIAGAFLIQQILLWRWESRWSAIEKPVKTLEETQANIQRYRPWYDDSFQSLSILRQLTESYPEDGAVWAKTVEIRDPSGARELPRVVCAGTARSDQALLELTKRLNASRSVHDVHIETQRGTSPLEFSFNFTWGQLRGAP